MAVTGERTPDVGPASEDGPPAPGAGGGAGTRSYAVAAGVLLVVATVASVGSQPFLAALAAPDLLSGVAAQPVRMETGVLLGVVAGLASAGVAVALYPVLRPACPGLAIGAVAFRVVEAVLAIVGALTLLALVSLGEQSLRVGGAERVPDAAAGRTLLALHHAMADVGLVVAFCLGGLLYYLAFYRTRLIPRWLSGWGILGVVVLLISVVLVVYGVIGPLSTAQVLLAVPIGIQEMVLAVWLIAKGFAAPVSA